MCALESVNAIYIQLYKIPNLEDVLFLFVHRLEFRL